MKNLFFILSLLLLLVGCKSQTEQAADTIYFGGDIITMEGDSPQYAEAVAVKESKILFVGSKEEVMKFEGRETELADLQGKTMLPGFIDAHGHAYLAGFQALAANLLPPPDGEANNIPTLIEITKEWAGQNEKAIGKVGWILGFGYDDAQLEEQRHPIADELDEISTELPVLVLNQ